MGAAAAATSSRRSRICRSRKMCNAFLRKGGHTTWRKGLAYWVQSSKWEAVDAAGVAAGAAEVEVEVAMAAVEEA